MIRSGGWRALRDAGAAAWRAIEAGGADPDEAAARARAWADWLAQAHAAQRPPDGAWRTWLFFGGRGAGKTRAGAEWLQAQAEAGARLALLGPSLHEVRAVMVEGVSGLKAIAPAAFRPVWETSRRRLVWPNGAEAAAFSAEDPDGLRGAQFHAAWADEFCAWRGGGEAALANLRLGLRLGREPRLAVTTTPRPSGALRRLRAEPGLAETRAATAANAAHLAPAFLEGLTAVYGGTRLAAQELEGQVVEAGGALWTAAQLAGCRGPAPERLERVVVAVDPPAGGAAGARGEGSACGIMVAGRLGERGFVLADRTATGLSPQGWAERVAASAAAWDAAAVVAEANQGGDMVQAVLGAAGVAAPVRLVRASQGKRARAEPVAALYEQGRVVHCGAFAELEEQLMALGGEAEAGGGGPGFDRADALVWALTDLLLDRRWEGPWAWVG